VEYEFSEVRMQDRATARKVSEDLYKEDYKAMREALPDEFGLLDENHLDKNLAKRLGHAFAKREGVRYGSERIHLARAGTESRAVLWAVRAGDSARESEEQVRLVSYMSS
jgi:hypothetical protein